MSIEEPRSQLHVVIILCVPFNYKPSNSTDKFTWG